MLSRLYTNSRSHCFWNLSKPPTKSLQSLKLTSGRETRRIEMNVSLFGSSRSSRLSSLGTLSSRVKMSKAKFRGNNRQWCVHGPNKGHVNIHSCLLWPSFTYCSKSSIMLSFQCCHVFDGWHPPRISGPWSKNESIARMMNVMFHFFNPAEFSHSGRIFLLTLSKKIKHRAPCQPSYQYLQKSGVILLLFKE